MKFKAPCCVYLLWHHDCRQAVPLAEEIFRWFQAPTPEISRLGLGIPVYYRMRPESDGQPPRPIDLSHCEVNIIVPLIDEHMAADPVWRSYLANLVLNVEKENKGAVYPVPLHSSAYRLKGVETINYLRVDRASDDPEESSESKNLRRVARIRQRLTEVANRKLLQVLKPKSNQPITVFISHAKADGLSIAESLRNEIYNYGQLQAFFDEADIPVGNDFCSTLNSRTKEAACMLAIVSDAYAGRPWCREEISVARRPQLEEGSKNLWFMNTVLVVENLNKNLTRTIPEFGNSPLMRWSKGTENKILDTLMRELLVSCYHRLNAKRISEKYPPSAGVKRHILTWVPDPISILGVLDPRKRERVEIVYPGNGLPAAEKALMSRLFSGRIEFKTFEDVFL